MTHEMEFHEVANIFPMMSAEEFESLKADIKYNGLLEPIWRHEGKIIDGRNRYQACLEIGVKPRFREWDGVGSLTAFVVSLNLHRRHLTESQRGMVAARLANMVNGGIRAGQNTIASQTANLQSEAISRAEAADLLNVSERTVNAAAKVKDEGAPELVRAVESGAASVSAAAEVASLTVEEQREIVAKGEAEILKAAKKIKAEKKEARKEQDRQALMEAQAYIEEQRESDLESVCDIRACSCADLFASGIRPDAVITDPPYPREFLPVFTELAQACKEANVPLVAVMSGQSYLPEVMERLCRFLDYRWTLAYMTPGGQSAQQWQAKVNTFWKPVLLFGESIDWLGDVATSKPNDNDKRFHEWGQSESGMADLIERLTKPGQLVCDPFMGGGTTAVVSLALGRRFVGCDIDAQLVKQAKERILS